MDVRYPNLNIRKIISCLLVGAGMLLGTWSPAAEAWAQEQILVSNYTNNTVTAYDRMANGDIAPTLSIATESGPHHIAINHRGREVFVSNNLTFSVTVYDYDTGVLKRTISGGLTGLNRPTGVAIDERNSELYVANDHGNSITVYPLLANGNIAPIRAIQGLATQLEGPSGVALDLFNNQIVVANYHTAADGGSITFYSRTANGNVAPTQKIQGPTTGLHLPQGIALDLVHKEILVANSAFDIANAGGIWVFLLTDSGNVAPFRLLTGSDTKLCNPMGLALDLVRDEIVVGNANFGNGSCIQSVTTYQRTASANTAPLRTISAGVNSGLSNPLGVDINTAPGVGTVTGPAVSQPVGTSVPISATFADTVQAPHTCTLNWGDGIVTSGVVVENTPTNISGSCTGAHTYTVPAIYSVVVAVSNGTEDTASSDPFTVFSLDTILSVKGTGKILSPAGAYKPTPSLSGPAKFAFDAKYKKGSTIPDGDVLFKIGKVKFKFKSTSVTTLSLTELTRATLTGSGTVRIHSKKHAAEDDCEDDNHFSSVTGAYDFKLVAVDGGPKSNAADRFRIIIWLRNAANPSDTSNLIYDNGQDSPLIAGKITIKLQ